MTRPTIALLLTLTIAAVLSAIGCNTNPGAVARTNVTDIDPANFDNECEPCRDFYQYSNGGWQKNNPIPAAYTQWSTWHELYDRNDAILKEILENAAGNERADRGSPQQLIGDFYYSAMDTARIEALAAQPLQADFERIDAIANLTDLQKVIAGYHLEGLRVLFDMDVGQDLIDNMQYTIYVGQGGLGLPDRDYYTKEDAESVELRAGYIQHVTNMFMLLGESQETAAAGAETVMGIETRLAEASLTRVERRDPANWYNLIRLDEATKQTPSFDWDTYLALLGQPDVKSVSSTPPKFFDRMEKLLQEVPLDDWKTYLRWHLIHDAAPGLSSDFVNENFNFYRATLRGAEELRPRWKRVLGLINWTIGEALGQLFVERAFPPESKESALTMVNNIVAALKDRIIALEWMGEETKQSALAKLSTLQVKIGYPDKWRDYSALDIGRESYVDNLRAASAFEVRRNLDKIGKPPDRTEWGMPPQIVNAYYNPQFNEIVFPAAILQPPFFDAEMDDAFNYGGIGAAIGHELTHGYDDQGRHFDAEGNMNEWWTPEDEERFTASTDKMVEQFNGYEVIDSVFVNGELTLGENIADLGGLLIAYDALEKALESKGVTQIVNGFSPAQRFFLSWSQVWRNNARDEDIKVQVNTDPHPPAKFRVNGPMSNMEAFHRAFGCKEGDAMVRPEETRPKIW